MRLHLFCLFVTFLYFSQLQQTLSMFIFSVKFSIVPVFFIGQPLLRLWTDKGLNWVLLVTEKSCKTD